MMEEYSFDGTELEYVESLQYMCSSITCGQRRQALKIAIRNNYSISDIASAMREFGVHDIEGEIIYFSEKIIDYNKEHSDGDKHE